MAVVKNLMVRAGADFSAITKQAKKVQQSASGMGASFSKAGSVIRKALGAAGIAFSLGTLINAAKDAKAAYDEQSEGQARLAQVMRNTMGASDSAIQSILDLTEAQEKLGVVQDDVQLAGAQELATYLTLKSSLEKLIPVMNDMAVQQYGYNVTAEQTQQIATMLGKVMEGQVGGLSRYGYYFTEAQAAVLKFGDEEQRAAMLAEVVEASVGGMNAALAATPTGRMVQLRNTMDGIKASFGQAVATVGTAFLPALNTVATILADVATLANRVAQSIANVFGGKSAAKAWSYAPASVAAATVDASEGMDNLGSAAKSAGKAIKDSLSTADFDKLHVLKEVSSSGSGGGGGGSSGGGGGGASGISETGAADETAESVGWLEKVLQGAKEKLADFKSGLDLSKLTQSSERFVEAIRPLAEDVGKGLSWVWDNVLAPMGQWTINEAVPATLDVLTSSIEYFRVSVEEAAPGIETFYDEILAPLARWSADHCIEDLQQIKKILDDLTGLKTGDASFSDLLGDFQFVSPLPGLSPSIFKDVEKSLRKVWAGLPSWFDKKVSTPIENFFDKSFSAISKKAGETRDRVQNAWSVFSTSVKTNVTEPVKKRFSEAWTSIQNGAATAKTNLQSKWSDAGAWFQNNVSGPIRARFSEGWTAVQNDAATAKANLQSKWSDAAAWFQNTVSSPIRQRFAEGWAAVQSGAAAAKANLQSTWSTVGSWFSANVSGPIRARFSEAWANVQSSAATAKANIQSGFSGLSGWINSNFLTPMKSNVRSAINGIIGYFEGMANRAISGVNSIIRALNNVKFSVPSWVPLIGGKSFGISLNTLGGVSLPRLAAGDVIEPNDEFLAVLGDQKSGRNIETPERLLRDIVREESSNAQLVSLLRDVIEAIYESKPVYLDEKRVDKALSSARISRLRAAGKA